MRHYVAYVNNLRANNGLPPIAVPVGVRGALHDARLDSHLDALNDEWRMRGHHLTPAFWQIVRARNHRRNRGWY